MSHVGQAAVEPPRVSEGGFLALMRHRNYALLWTGQLVSQIGDRFHWVAISLWVYAQTGSALSVSYAVTALMVGPAIVGIFAGALVDRLDRRKILIYGDLVRAVLVFAIPDLMALGLIWVYIDLFLISVASAFFRPAMFASIPQSVPKDRLLPANAFFASMDTSTEIFGPALAGLVIAQLGYASAIYLDAFSYMISAMFVSALRFDLTKSSESGRVLTRPLGTLQSIRDGLQYIRRDQIQIALLAFVIGGYWLAGLNSLQTAMAKGVLGVSDQQYGWFQSAGGIGLVLASLLLGWYGRHAPRGLTIVFSYLLWALAAAMMGLSANYGMLLVSGFWAGFANMLLFVSVGTIMMEHTPPDKIGRTITTRQVVVALMRAAALLGFGWLADLTSVSGAILAMAAISFVGTLAAALRFPALLRYRLAGEPTSGRVAPITAEAGTTPGFGGVFGRFLETHADPAFVASEQRWLNVVTLSIAVLGWLVLLVELPIQAIGVGLTVAGTIALVAVTRSIVRRLRSHTRRYEQGRGESITTKVS